MSCLSRKQRRKISAECQDYILPENCKFSRPNSDWILDWKTPVANILIVRKDIRNLNIESSFEELCTWLLKNEKLTVHVESAYYEGLVTHLSESNGVNKQSTNRVMSYKVVKGGLAAFIDVVLTIGGDGTLMKASGYFCETCPPIVAFNLGTIGFLAPFGFEGFETSTADILDGHVPCVLRNRLSFCIRSRFSGSNSDLHQSLSMSGEGDMCPYRDCLDEDDTLDDYLALNEISIDRGSSSHMLSLVIEINKKVITKITGDGLIVSSPTGSTAYSMAAGASIIHPSVRGVLLTPINPFSLSMRPIFLPVGAEITVYLDPEGRRDKASVSYDGNRCVRDSDSTQLTLTRNQHVSICVSRFPVISLCRTDPMSDWFLALQAGLNWNKTNGHASSMTATDE